MSSMKTKILISADVRDAVVRSRNESLLGDFQSALVTLRDVSVQVSTEDQSMQDVIAAEIARIAIFQANHFLITEVVSRELESNDAVYDLLNLVTTMNQIWRRLDLLEPVSLANKMFNRYCHALRESEVDEFVLRILFYCLVIFDWHRMYGDGLPEPQFEWDQDSLQSLIFQLAEHHLYLEMLDVIEFFIEEPEDILLTFSAALKQSSSPAYYLFMLCLIRIHCKNQRLDIATAHLQSISFAQQTATKGRGLMRTLRMKKPKDTELPKLQDSFFSLQRACIEQGYLAQSLNAADRVGNLLHLAGLLETRMHYMAALRALERAAELVNVIPDPSFAHVLGVQIHRSLEAICVSIGDQLSETLIRFRKCDLLNSASGDFLLARVRRGELLKMPICQKLPYLQKFHYRQWAEYYMLHQRQPAVTHAERYYTFCQKCRSEHERSRAQTILFQSLFLPERSSEESRLDFLEGLRRDIEQSIEVDKGNHWVREMVEKQLLLVDVIYEIAQLEQEDEDTIAASVIEILDSAEEVVSGFSDDTESAALKCQIDFLRTSANIFLGHQQLPDDNGPPIIHRGEGEDVNIDDHIQKVDPGRYLRPALTAIVNGTLSGLEDIHNEISARLKQSDQAGDIARRAALLDIKGKIYYFLAKFDEGKTRRFMPVVELTSRTAIIDEALSCFEEAMSLRTQIAAEIREPDLEQSTATALTSSQAYFASDLLLEQSIDMSIELAHELDDSARTWKWMQLGKAHAFTQVLSSSVPSLTPQAIDFVAYNHPDFRVLQDIQSASATQLVFVDWISYGLIRKRLLMSICRVVGRDCRSTQMDIEVDLDELRSAAARINEVRMNDSDAQRYLEPFVRVISPLKEYSKPGDIIILSPTSPFHNVPLHAVSLGFQTLIERNPVVYVPSQLALLTCLQRLSAPGQDVEAPKHWKAVVAAAYESKISDPSMIAEKRMIFKSAANLAWSLQAKSHLGGQPTEHTVLDNLDSADLFHFHGHGIVDERQPTNQGLILGDGYLTIPQISSLKMQAAHVCLIACSGATQDFSLSLDEPFGLLSAFLLGGATSVIGALWPIQSSSGRVFTEIYYEYFLKHVDRKELGPIVNVARALQYTVLEIKKRPGLESHYHWAPYVCYGSWFCRRKPGSW